MTYGRSLERHLKYFGLVDDGGKAITFSEWATLAQDRAGWLKSSLRMRLSALENRSCGHLGATPESHQRRSGASWRGVPKRLNNGALSSMQKQTQKRLKSGFKIIS